MVAVTVNERPTVQRRQRSVVFLQELAQDEGLLRQAMCVRIVGHQLDELVTEYRRATWFEHDDGSAVLDLASERKQRVGEPPLCRVEHAVVEQRSTAADRRWRHRHL